MRKPLRAYLEENGDCETIFCSRQSHFPTPHVFRNRLMLRLIGAFTLSTRLMDRRRRAVVFRTPDQIDRDAGGGAFFRVTDGVLHVPDAVDVVIDSRVRVTADV